jgi:hypothetical protein
MSIQIHTKNRETEYGYFPAMDVHWTIDDLIAWIAQSHYEMGDRNEEIKSVVKRTFTRPSLDSGSYAELTDVWEALLDDCSCFLTVAKASEASCCDGTGSAVGAE